MNQKYLTYLRECFRNGFLRNGKSWKETWIETFGTEWPYTNPPKKEEDKK